MTSAQVPAWIGLGSNLDEPENHIRLAFAELGAIERTTVVDCSRLYRSTPWGMTGQPDFINAVARIDSALSARALLDALLGIERGHGRRRDAVRWGPRTLDLDLLVYGDARVDALDLHVPHPRIAERAFVLLPLAELAPSLIIPGVGRVADLLAGIDTSSCVAIDAVTR